MDFKAAWFSCRRFVKFSSSAKGTTSTILRGKCTRKTPNVKCSTLGGTVWVSSFRGFVPRSWMTVAVLQFLFVKVGTQRKQMLVIYRQHLRANFYSKIQTFIQKLEEKNRFLAVWNT